MKVVMDSMIRGKEGSFSNFMERDVLKCLYFNSISFVGRASNLKFVRLNRFERWLIVDYYFSIQAGELVDCCQDDSFF